jgi:hypothetical protein
MSASVDPTQILDSSQWRTVEQRCYDPHGETELTRVVIRAVADAEGVTPAEICSPSLAEVIDIDGVAQALFRSADEDMTTAAVRFLYRGHMIVVDSEGTVKVSKSR